MISFLHFISKLTVSNFVPSVSMKKGYLFYFHFKYLSVTSKNLVDLIIKILQESKIHLLVLALKLLGHYFIKIYNKVIFRINSIYIQNEYILCEVLVEDFCNYYEKYLLGKTKIYEIFISRYVEYKS